MTGSSSTSQVFLRSGFPNPLSRGGDDEDIAHFRVPAAGAGKHLQRAVGALDTICATLTGFAAREPNGGPLGLATTPPKGNL
ncbi:MAG: hypothetical protein OES09_15905 [Gammaproteobacteria bacterium]|nr:hypothetical protein [Gammaproteobacteria bacterium]